MLKLFTTPYILSIKIWYLETNTRKESEHLFGNLIK